MTDSHIADTGAADSGDVAEPVSIRIRPEALGELPDSPPAALRFRRGLELRRALRELRGTPEIVRSLAERELRSRYAQAILGFTWNVLQPLITVFVFAAVVDRLDAKIATGGVPYALFVYLGQLPWTFFSSSITNGSNALVANTALLNKVYAPREVFALGSLLTRVVDTLCAAAPLALFFIADSRAPRFPESLWAIPLLAILVLFTTGLTMLLSVLVVYARDVRHAIPVIVQLLYFLTPVLYGFDRLHFLTPTIYSALNPVAAVIDGLRRSVFFGEAPLTGPTVAAAISSVIVLVLCYMGFKHFEQGIADVA